MAPSNIVTGNVRSSEARLEEEFIWEVDITEAKAIGDILHSDNFGSNNTVDSNQWSLQLFPLGTENGSKDFISLYLNYLGEVDLEVTFTLSLIDQQNKKIAERESSHIFNEKEKGWGYPKFYKQKDLVDPYNCLLKDNLLSICCKIIFNKKPVVSDKYIKSIKRNEEFNDFEKLLNDQDFSDVILKAGEEEINAHKSILAARSPVFKAMFKHDMREKNENTVQIDDIRVEVLQEFIEFIYTGKVENIYNIVCELLKAAEKYEVLGLKTLCEETMCDTLTNKNALEFLEAAIINNACKIKDKAIKIISTHLKNFVSKSKFKSFGLSHPEIMFEIMQTTVNVYTFEDSEEENESERPEEKKKKKENINFDQVINT